MEKVSLDQKKSRLKIKWDMIFAANCLLFINKSEAPLFDMS